MMQYICLWDPRCDDKYYYSKNHRGCEHEIKYENKNQKKRIKLELVREQTNRN